MILYFHEIIAWILKRKDHVIAVLILLVCMMIIRWLEIQAGHTLAWYDVIWWAFVTMTTIGYGDVVVHNPRSKLFATIYIIVSLIVLGDILKRIHNRLFINHHQRMNGRLHLTYKHHCVVYAPNADDAKQFFIHYNKTNPSTTVVFILPLQDRPGWMDDDGYSEMCDFVSGDPSDSEVIYKANIYDANEVVLLPDQDFADIKTLSYITAIRLAAPHVPIHAMIVDYPKYHKMFLKSGVTKLLDITTFHYQLVTRSISDDVDIVLRDLLSNDEGSELYSSPLQPLWYGKTLADIKRKYLGTDISIICLYHQKTAQISYRDMTVIDEHHMIYYIARDRFDQL